MKREVIINPQNYITPENCTELMIYGVEQIKYVSDETKLKGFIIRDDFINGRYKAYCAHFRLTEGNSWGEPNNDIKLFISGLIKTGYFKVHIFDTYRELYQWLAE